MDSYVLSNVTSTYPMLACMSQHICLLFCEIFALMRCYIKTDRNQSCLHLIDGTR